MIREDLKVIANLVGVEVLHYILQCLIGIFEVLVTEIRFSELKWCGKMSMVVSQF